MLSPSLLLFFEILYLLNRRPQRFRTPSLLVRYVALGYFNFSSPFLACLWSSPLPHLTRPSFHDLIYPPPYSPQICVRVDNFTLLPSFFSTPFLLGPTAPDRRRDPTPGDRVSPPPSLSEVTVSFRPCFFPFSPLQSLHEELSASALPSWFKL